MTHPVGPDYDSRSEEGPEIEMRWTMVDRWTFDSFAARDAFVAERFPSRQAQPLNLFALPDGSTLLVHGARVEHWDMVPVPEGEPPAEEWEEPEHWEKQAEADQWNGEVL